jgi:hypothetical protein
MLQSAQQRIKLLLNPILISSPRLKKILKNHTLKCSRMTDGNLFFGIIFSPWLKEILKFLTLKYFRSSIETDSSSWYFYHGWKFWSSIQSKMAVRSKTCSLKKWLMNNMDGLTELIRVKETIWNEKKLSGKGNRLRSASFNTRLTQNWPAHISNNKTSKRARVSVWVDARCNVQGRVKVYSISYMHTKSVNQTTLHEYFRSV